MSCEKETTVKETTVWMAAGHVDAWDKDWVS